MKKLTFRLMGIILLVTAIVGIVISISALTGVWLSKGPITKSLSSTLDLVIDSLQTTSDGLEVAKSSLQAASTNISILSDTIDTTHNAVHDTVPLISSLITLMSDDLPDTILATQTALSSAQASARLIEDVLSLLTSLPLMPGTPYQPEVPLHQALADVSGNLDPLLLSFDTMEANLKISRGHLIMIEAELSIIARRVEEINVSLADAGEVITQYQELVSDIQSRLERLQALLPIGMMFTAWILTGLCIWLGIIQVGFLVQGLDLLVRSKQESPDS